MEKSKQLTSSFKNANILVMCMIALCLLAGSTIKKNAETDDLQTIANIPALDSLHESIYKLWHDAYPKKDYALIKNILPKLSISVSKLSESALPEILHSKQAKWDNEIKNLQNNLSTLQKAVNEDNKESILKTVESLHSSYEKLVRIIRPVLSELESFHEELYKVYHSYMPDNDIEKIKTIIPTMKMKIGLLKQARLPQNLADRQNKFDEAVSKLENSLNELENFAKTNSKEKIQPAVDKLHSDYQSIDALLQ
jgi:vacuolar-type H+-ATPase subunit H